MWWAAPVRPPSSAAGLHLQRDGGAAGLHALPHLVAGWRATARSLDAECLDGFITSNMAIVPTNNGSIDAYAKSLTQLILDISGYFAP